MTITDLLPWNRDKDQVEVRSQPENDSLLDLRQEIDRLFDDFFERPFGMTPFRSDESWGLRGFSPSIDLSESDKEIKVTAELPGMEPEDIDLELHDNFLSIRGEKKSENEQKSDRYYRLERSYGSFQRSIPLPNKVEPDKVDANFKKGVLTIKMPKSETEKSKRIKIEKG